MRWEERFSISPIMSRAFAAPEPPVPASGHALPPPQSLLESRRISEW